MTSNWEYVYATWDTSKGGITADSTWKFWAVVWVTDSNGNLVAEVPGHGLTAVPPANVQYNSLADVPIEIYSNNLGFFNQTFDILPAVSATAVGQAAPVSKQLQIGKVTARNNDAVTRYVPTAIIAPHIVLGDHIDAVVTQYYDGDPKKGGTLFDTQLLPRVGPDVPYIDNARFTPKTCGTHQIFVRSSPTDGSARVATATTTFKVTDDPVRLINEMINYVSAPSYPPRYRSSMLTYLNNAKRSFTKKQTQAGTIQMQVLFNLVQGGAFFVPSDVQEALATSMKGLLGCL